MDLRERQRPSAASLRLERSVTVVIVTRDRRDELTRTVGLLGELTPAARVIVVDNGSEDGTAWAVAAGYPRVRLVRSRSNLGALGRNLAVRGVQTRYVAFCDDDVRWQAGSLTRAADLLDANPALASVTARILVDPSLEEDPIVPELRDSPVPGPWWLPGPPPLSVLASATMFRVAAFRQVAGFFPRLWLGGEEELLAIDLATRGWWMCYAEELIVHHAPSKMRQLTRRRQMGIRNTLWTTWLRRPASRALVRTGTVLRSLPRDRASAVAVGEAVSGLPWVLRERGVVPPRVERGLRLLEEPQRNSKARRYVG